MAKEVKFSKDARSEIAKGIQALYDAVRVTLGPKGRNVIIEQDFGAPMIVNDGATIAASIELDNHFANLGVGILNEAASKTNDYVGDGTTTAIILTASLIELGLEEISNGTNPVLLRRGLEYLLPQVLSYITEVSHPVASMDDLERIAVISSGSMSIGELIKNAYLEVGINGAISIEDANGLNPFLDVVKGYSYDKGYISPYMQTDKNKQLAMLENPLILVTNRKINAMSELVPYLEVAIKNARPILIIADDIDQEVVSSLIVNKMRGVFNCLATRAYGYAEKRDKFLEDIAFLTGATLIDERLQMDLVNSTVDVLGSCKKVICNKERTTIMDGDASVDAILERVESLKEELNQTQSEYEQDLIRTRISKMLGGVAVIKVAATTETEQKELKLRIEDALNATKAASISGVIEGGGKVFYELASQLNLPSKYLHYTPALNILKKALTRPFKQIIENAGLDFSDVIKQVSHQTWYNAETNTYCSMLKAGIIDPASVAKSAITCAISTAGLFLTTECAIVNKDTKHHHNLEENLF